jgi:hypothetical protein
MERMADHGFLTGSKRCNGLKKEKLFRDCLKRVTPPRILGFNNRLVGGCLRSAGKALDSFVI